MIVCEIIVVYIEPYLSL